MAYRDFSTAEIRKRLATVATSATVSPPISSSYPATLATVATLEARNPQTVANAATVARVEGKSEKSEGAAEGDDFEREERLAVYGDPEPTKAAAGSTDRAEESGKVCQSSKPVGSADSFQNRPADWMPEPSAGVRILRPAVELPAIEYDAHIDKLIAAAPAGSVEAQRLAFAKRKGWVVECEARRIFTRGRF